MKIIRIVITLSILASIIFFAYNIDFTATEKILGKIGFKFFWLLVSTFLSFWMATFSWYYCLPKAGMQISLWRLFYVRHIGETVGIVSPASVAGAEALKVYILHQYGLNRNNVLSSVLLARLMMVISLPVLLLLAIADMAMHGYSTKALPVKTLILAVGFILILTFLFAKLIQRLRKSPRFKTRINKAGGRLKKILESVNDWFYNFQNFFTQHKKNAIAAFAFMVLHWAVGALEFYLIMHFLGIPIRFSQSVLLDLGVVLFKSAGWFVPYQVGVEELGNKMMLAMVGIHDEGIWVAVSILRRARQLFWIAVGLLFYFLIVKRKPLLETE